MLRCLASSPPARANHSAAMQMSSSGECRTEEPYQSTSRQQERDDLSQGVTSIASIDSSGPICCKAMAVTDSTGIDMRRKRDTSREMSEK